MQFYTANFLDGKLKGKGGVAYNKQQAFCLEDAAFPRLGQSRQLPIDDPETGVDVQADDDLQVFGAVMR